MIQRNEPTSDDFTNRSASRLCTDVTHAIMTGADLRGVDLRGVRGLTCHQVRSAHIDSRTRLPLRLRLLCAFSRLTSGIGGPHGNAAALDR
jgi:uncharacterized protein YjbI with pentapeptide repeats